MRAARAQAAWLAANPPPAESLFGMMSMAELEDGLPLPAGEAVALQHRTALDLLVRRWQPRLVAHGWRLTGDADLARALDEAGVVTPQVQG